MRSVSVHVDVHCVLIESLELHLVHTFTEMVYDETSFFTDGGLFHTLQPSAYTHDPNSPDSIKSLL